MSINHLISIGLYISGIVVFAIYMRHECETVIDTDLKEEFADLAVPEILWPIVVFIMIIVYIVLCCAWPYWITKDLWKRTKAAFKKT